MSQTLGRADRAILHRMRIVLSTHSLQSRGGSETYLTTVAAHLQRLGHDVTLHANELGQAVVEEHPELRLAIGEHALPSECDAVVAQDAITSFSHAARYPSTPQLFVAHSTLHDHQLPPQLPGVCRSAVALNERVARRLRALGGDLDVVRLRQPVDLDIFAPLVPLRANAPRVLALGNRLSGPRLELLEAVCRELKFECAAVGRPSDSVGDTEHRILNADLVVGYGRCIIEAMACGRAAYVWDHLGGDGWVTADTYPALEADGFGGRATDMAVDRGRLRDELASYDPDMGLVNRDLAVRHHGPRDHAQALVALLARQTGPAPVDRTPLDELGRLARVSWDAERRAMGYAKEVGRLHKELRAIRHTRRYRLAAALASPLDALRRTFPVRGRRGKAAGRYRAGEKSARLNAKGPSETGA